MKVLKRILLTCLLRRIEHPIQEHRIGSDSLVGMRYRKRINIGIFCSKCYAYPTPPPGLELLILG